MRGRLVAYERQNYGYEINADFKAIVRLMLGLEYLDKECARRALAEVLANVVDELFDTAHATSCDTIHSNYAIFRVVRYYDQASGRAFDWYYGPWALRDVIEQRQFGRKLELEGTKGMKVVIAKVGGVTDDFGDDFEAWIVMYEVNRIVHGIIIVERDGVVMATNGCRKFVVHADEGSSVFAWYLAHIMDTLG